MIMIIIKNKNKSDDHKIKINRMIMMIIKIKNKSDDHDEHKN